MGRADRARRSRRPTSRLRRAAEGLASFAAGFLRRLPRAAAPLALLLTALAFAAQAQTTIKLVGNTSQGGESGYSFSWDLWQPFTTGSSPTYKLTGVDIELSQVTGNPAYTLSIRTHTKQGTFSYPGTHLVTLENPGTLVAGLNRHTVPGNGIDLAPNTTYQLFLDVTAPAAEHVLKATNSGAEDAGGLRGWSIADWVGYRRWNLEEQSGSNATPLKFALHGHVQTLAGKPTGVAVSASTESGALSVSWSKPGDLGTGTPTGYDVRYYAGNADPVDEADWVEDRVGLPDDIGPDAVSATIRGLLAGTTYRVQVRAVTAAGGGEWSDSASATTGSPPSANNAPRLLEDNGRWREAYWRGNICKVRDDPDTIVWRRHDVSPGATVSTETLTGRRGETSEWPKVCSASTPFEFPPVFDDVDGDALTLFVEPEPVPANVRVDAMWVTQPEAAWTTEPTQSDYFRLHNEGGGGRLHFRGAAALRQTNVLATVTATDPHGASVKTRAGFRVNPVANTATPQFPATVADQDSAVGRPFLLVLPEATGGDVGSGALRFPYYYAVSGLPQGLSFDPATVTISGAPTEAGSFTVTYTADDADGNASGYLSPTNVDETDRASETFSIEVGAGAAAPKISSVTFRAWATYDANSDGRRDTYVEGDVVLVDVAFTEPVKVTGDGDVRLNLDLGADDDTQTNSRRTLTHPSVLNGGTKLRFEYTVAAGDTDTDGMWVQTDASDRVVLEPGTARVVGGDSGLAAVLTKSLSTTGSALLKVDGSKASEVGPRPTGATVNGSTLTVTFDQALGAMGAPDGRAPDWYFFIHGTRSAQGHNDELGAYPGTIAIVGDNNDKVQMTVEAARPGEVITLTYRLRSIWSVRGPLKGADGKPAPGFADYPVTNETPGAAAGPSLLRASVSGTTLRLVFDGDLDEASEPPGNAFTVNTGSVGAGYIDIRGTGQASVLGTVVTVELSHAVSADARAWVAYAKPDSAPLQDADAAAVLPFGFFAIETIYDVAPPRYVDGGAVQTETGASPKSMVVLGFDEALDTGSVPAGADFGVTVGTGTEINPASVAVKGKGVELTLNAAAAAGTTVTVSYTRGTSPIQDRAGNAVATFAQAKELTATAAGAPAGQSAAVDGSVLTVTWDKPLNPALVPAPERFGLNYHAYTEEMQEWIDPYNNWVEFVAVRGSSLRLVLLGPVYPCEGATPFTVSFEKTTDGPNLQGLDGVDADALEYMDVSNERASRCKQRGFSMSGDGAGSPGKSVTLKSEVALDTGRELATSLFSLKGTSPPALEDASYAVDGTGVVLSLSRAVTAGEALTVRYERPADAPGLWGADGNQIADFSVAVATPATPALSVSDARAAEGEAVVFTVSLLATSDEEVTVDYATSDGTAQSGTDFTAASGTLTFAVGATTQTVRVETAADSAAEDDETFALTLSNPSGATLSTASATGTIEDGPAALTASFEGLPEAHDGAKRFAFEIRFSEEFRGLRLPVLKRALAVTGGRLIDAKRTVPGQNRSVTVRVRPSQSGALTLALAAPSDCTAADAVCTSDGRKLSAAVSAAVPGPHTLAANVPATGAPTITGTAQVGATLTASAAGIADADGLTGATFAWQWVSSAGTADSDIAGATGASYTLTEADEGRTVKVRVSFTDDEGHAETLVSAATAAVAPRPLTASFHGLPAEHDGRKLFAFEIRFSEEFRGLRLAAFKAGALQVTGGRLVDAKRTVAGQNRSVTVRVRPTSFEDMEISLPATADCSAPAAICTKDGRKLSKAVSATVRGPVAVSVADARANEGADAALAFAVTLSRAASGTVTVDYTTRDGTAKAGEDYEHTRSTLSFAAGELEKTVSVPLLDDALDEGEETFTLKLTGAQGAAIADGEATGTIENSDPLQEMWLSRFGRTVADHVTEAVSDRLAAPLSGAQVTVGGQSVDLAEAGDAARLGRTLTSIAQVMGAPSGSASGGEPGSAFGAGPGSAPGQAGAGNWPETGLGIGQSPAANAAPARDMTGRELLLGSAFHLVRDSDGGGPGLAAWGRVTTGGFDGEAPADGGNVRIDGNVTTGILGADAQWNRLLAGVAVSVSEGEGSFDQPGVDSGAIESTMTTVSPYARFMVNERVSVWGLAGWGNGDMTITQAANENQPERVTRTDLEMRLAAVGGRRALLTQDEDGGIDFALKADAFLVETEWKAVSNEGDTTAGASRVRLVLEGGRAFQVGDGATLRPSLELGLRHDGGDAETGTGVELGGGVSWTDPVSGLSVEATTRMLVAHADQGYEEWGASGAVRLGPGERGRGLSFSLSPTLGATSSAAERLWGARDAGGLAPGGEVAAARGLQGELGYGLPLFGDRFTGTPNAGFGLSDSARDWRIGWRLNSAIAGDPGFEVNLDATRQEAANGNEAPEHGLMLRGTVRW